MAKKQFPKDEKKISKNEIKKLIEQNKKNLKIPCKAQPEDYYEAIPMEWPNDNLNIKDLKIPQHLVTYRMYHKNLTSLAEGVVELLNNSIGDNRKVKSGHKLFNALEISKKSILEACLEDNSIFMDFINENVDSAYHFAVTGMIEKIIELIEADELDDDDAFTQLIAEMENMAGIIELIAVFLDDIRGMIEQVDSIIEDLKDISLPNLNKIVSEEAIWTHDDKDWKYLELSLKGMYYVTFPDDVFSIDQNSSSITLNIKATKIQPDEDAKMKLTLHYKILCKETQTSTGWMKIKTIGSIKADEIRAEYSLKDSISSSTHNPDWNYGNDYKRFRMTKNSNLKVEIDNLDIDFSGLTYLTIFVTIALVIGPLVGLAGSALLKALEGWISDKLEAKIEEKAEDKKSDLDDICETIFEPLYLPVNYYYKQPFLDDGSEYGISLEYYSTIEDYAIKIWTKEKELEIHGNDDETDLIFPHEEDWLPHDGGDILDRQDPIPDDNAGNEENIPLIDPRVYLNLEVPQKLANEKGLMAIKHVLEKYPMNNTKTDTVIVSFLLDGYSPSEIAGLEWEHIKELDKQKKFSKRSKVALKGLKKINNVKNIFSDKKTNMKYEANAIALMGYYYFSKASKIMTFHPELFIKKEETPVPFNKTGSSFDPVSCSYTDTSTLSESYGSKFDPLWAGLSVNCYMVNKLYYYLYTKESFAGNFEMEDPNNEGTIINCEVSQPSSTPTVDFTGDDGSKPSLKASGIVLKVQTDSVETEYDCAIKVSLKPVCLKNKCLDKLSAETFGEFMSIMSCLVNSASGITYEFLLAALYRYFIFLENDGYQVEVNGKYNDGLSDAKRERLVLKALKQLYSALPQVPALFDIYYKYGYSTSNIMDYDVSDGWLNVYRKYKLDKLEFTES